MEDDARLSPRAALKEPQPRAVTHPLPPPTPHDMLHPFQKRTRGHSFVFWFFWLFFLAKGFRLFTFVDCPPPFVDCPLPPLPSPSISGWRLGRLGRLALGFSPAAVRAMARALGGGGRPSLSPTYTSDGNEKKKVETSFERERVRGARQRWHSRLYRPREKSDTSCEGVVRKVRTNNCDQFTTRPHTPRTLVVSHNTHCA
jgi:hypothetical protein